MKRDDMTNRLMEVWAVRALVVLLLIGATAASGQVTPDDECHPVEIPNLEEWLLSAHADAEAEAFTHWDEDDPPEIPTSCARCHSMPGHLDFLGADGSEPGVVDQPAPLVVGRRAAREVVPAQLLGLAVGRHRLRTEHEADARGDHAGATDAERDVRPRRRAQRRG